MMELFIWSNLITLGILVSVYYIVERSMSGHLFYDVSYLLLYKFLFVPLILIIINTVLYFMGEVGYLTIPMILVNFGIPIVKVWWKKYRNEQDHKLSNKILEKSIPVILSHHLDAGAPIVKENIYVIADEKEHMGKVVIKTTKNENVDYSTLRKKLTNIIQSDFPTVKIKIIYDFPFIPQKKSPPNMIAQNRWELSSSLNYGMAFKNTGPDTYLIVKYMNKIWKHN